MTADPPAWVSKKWARGAVEEQHDLGGDSGGRASTVHGGDHQHHPDIEGHAPEAHPAAAHGEGRGDEIDGRRDRPESHHEDGEVPVVVLFPGENARAVSGA